MKVLSVLRVWVGQADKAEGKGLMSSREITLTAGGSEPSRESGESRSWKGGKSHCVCWYVRHYSRSQPSGAVCNPHLRDEETWDSVLIIANICPVLLTMNGSYCVSRLSYIILQTLWCNSVLQMRKLSEVCLGLPTSFRSRVKSREVLKASAETGCIESFLNVNSFTQFFCFFSLILQIFN